jgi:hypothetical protein
VFRHLFRLIVQFEGQTWIIKWTHEVSSFNQTNKYILDALKQQQVASMWSLPWQTMTRTWNVARKLEKNAFFVRQCNQKSFNLNSRYHKWKMIDSVKSQTWGSDKRKFKTWGRKKIKSVSLKQKIQRDILLQSYWLRWNIQLSIL